MCGSMRIMRALRVRELTSDERDALQAGLRSSQGFTVRRCQIILASARGLRASQIAELVGCSDQQVRNVIRAFDARGLGAMSEQSRRPKTAVKELDGDKLEHLRDLLHRSPREFGKDRSLWSLELAADVLVARGLTRERVSRETVREAIRRLGVGWKRAKNWITSPDPAYVRKKTGATD